MLDDSSNSPVIQIPLTRGYVTIVSPEDADLAEVKWCVRPTQYRFYASRRAKTARTNNEYATVNIHRIILERMIGRELVKGECVDHIDMNGLNNQRSNLRLATNAQNQQNKPAYSTNKCGYKGVYWAKDRQKWRAGIQVNEKTINLGQFDTAVEAAKAYDIAAIEHHGEFARLNFPAAQARQAQKRLF